MLQWLSENLATILVCAGLAAIVAVIIAVMVRDKKRENLPAGVIARTAQCPAPAIRNNQGRGDGITPSPLTLQARLANANLELRRTRVPPKAYYQ